jgi:hypothetical protein
MVGKGNRLGMERGKGAGQNQGAIFTRHDTGERQWMTSAKRGRGHRATRGDPEEPTPAERCATMTWAQRLKRVFGIDIETCPACGGALRIIACIDEPEAIEKILTDLAAKGAAVEASRVPPCRAPRQRGLFDRADRPTMQPGCDVSGEATAAVGLVAGARVKGVPANPSHRGVAARCRGVRAGVCCPARL